MDYKSEMAQLRRTLNEAGYRYYVLDDPTMSDYEYDHMLRRLEELEAEHPGGDCTRFSYPAGRGAGAGELSAGGPRCSPGEPAGRLLPGGGGGVLQFGWQKTWRKQPTV